MKPLTDRRNQALAAVSAIAVIAAFALPPVPQDPAYHNFADQRNLLGIPNLWNVVSNLPFLFVAGFGLIRFSSLARPVPANTYAILCVGVLLVCFGSGYYHWAPSNATLAWDRLPMTIAFMALMALMLGERVSQRLGRLALWPLLLLGAGSVGYWHWTELRGAGDLRPYGLVQFLPMLLIPMMLLLYPQKYVHSKPIWIAIAFYALAKLAEHFDREIFQALGWISGHSIKHLLASVAVLFIVLAVARDRAEERDA